MCSSDDVITSLLQPTTYCTVQGIQFTDELLKDIVQNTGATLHYLFVEFAVFWFAYICFMFYKVVFPFHYKKMEKKSLKHIQRAVLFIGNNQSSS